MLSVIRVLGPHRAETLDGIDWRADVGEQELLDARADRTHGKVALGMLLDLHHAREVAGEFDGTAST